MKADGSTPEAIEHVDRSTQDRSQKGPASSAHLPTNPDSSARGLDLWGRYQRVGLLGRGGMGEVYEARDTVLGRTVALKFLLGAGNERAVRLLQEARAQARIDHPNVCKVYEAGELEGKPYIAMQLVRGKPLGEASVELSLPEKVRAMKQVAEAVHEAHRLGVIHRDLKPSNILLGRDDDGRWAPMVMDFGLAYEINRGHGLTGTWALMGTPAYMAPEQARGEVRSVDRRSDVYGLGATFYELLTGKPPFAASTPAATVLQVLNDEPRPPSALMPRLPVDLETITLKCLHKEPDRRYPTAKALADDLGRYLEGEPIAGRRPGFGERLGRWGRRHPLLVAVSALSLVATVVIAGLFAYSQLEAARREQLAQELGQQAKEVEWLLRTAQALPLHDTTRERQYVRERMRAIAARYLSGNTGEGLVHDALGRGHLALGEFDQARDELSLARRLGVDSPELNYALGRALGELYRRALEAARRGGEHEWAAARRKTAEAKYLAPALSSLERSRGIKAESPRYLEGLIALYRRDYDAATTAADQAIAEVPWAYEARKLAGDVAFAHATERLERGDYAAARDSFDEAARLYERASEAGRSDAPTHEALAAAWLERSEIDRRLGSPRRPSLDRALVAANKAIEADPTRASAHTRRAYVLMHRYKLQRLEGASDAELGPALSDWLTAATRAVELDPGDPYAYDALGLGHTYGGLQDMRAGRDPMPALGRAAAWLSKALEIEPDYPWGLNDLAVVYRSRGQYLLDHAEDPRHEYAEADRLLRDAVQSDPAYLFAYVNLGDIHTSLAAYELSRGRSPEEDAEKALDAAMHALTLDPRFYGSLNQAALAELVRAEYLADLGEDPRPSIERAFGFVDRLLAINPAFSGAWIHRAQGHHLTARHALRRGEDPRASLDAGRRSLDEAYRRNVVSADCRVLGSRLHRLEAAWSQKQERAAAPALARALAEAKAAVALQPYAEAYQELALVHWRLAEARPSSTAPTLIDEGLAQIDRALRLAPDLAEAHAVRGGLLLARTRATNDTLTRRRTARQAASELKQALTLNPLLRGDYEAPLRETEGLAGQGP